jgi:hypothetical protein
MKELRSASPRPPEDSAVPHEVIYADDADTISKSLDYIKSTEEKAGPCLKNWDLLVNNDKTEHTTLKRGRDEDDEPWRKTKKLGTLLGDSQELQRRKQLAAASFQSLKRIWSRKQHNKISADRRLRLYNAYVVPVLTYNACTWALTDTQLDELDAFHRRQMRAVLGITYPRKISNEKLYERCNTQALRHTIRGARWRMFGHVLRMTDHVPAKYAMKRYFDPRINIYRGRPRTTIQTVLDNDLKAGAANLQADFPLLDIPNRLHTITDLEQLERIASIRPNWKSIVAYMQVSPPSKPKRLRPRRHE